MIMEEDYTFSWSNCYRVFLLVVFMIPFVDIFIQLALDNWAWLIVSVIFSVIILVMIIFSYIKPFIKLSNGILRFYLVPIAPFISQSIILNEISSYYVKKSNVTIILKNGRKARANLYAIKPADRELLLECLKGAVETA